MSRLLAEVALNLAPESLALRARGVWAAQNAQLLVMPKQRIIRRPRARTQLVERMPFIVPPFPTTRLILTGALLARYVARILFVWPESPCQERRRPRRWASLFAVPMQSWHR